jgi:hypothetical protein
VKPEHIRSIFKTTSTAMMNVPTKTRDFVSPNCVVPEASRQWEGRQWESRQWEGMTEVTDTFLYLQRQVRFSDQVSIINSNLTEELVQELWFSRQEIQDFHKEAKQQAKGFREQHSELAQELGTLVQEFTKESSLQALFCSPRAQQIMQSLPGTTIRGLERYLHVIIGRYRVLHWQGLLAIQKGCPKEHDAAILEQLLRPRSLYTSRDSWRMEIPCTWRLAFGKNSENQMKI